jgi:hypothetical protein
MMTIVREIYLKATPLGLLGGTIFTTIVLTFQKKSG